MNQNYKYFLIELIITILFVILLIVFATKSFGQDTIYHNGYKLVYSEQHEQPSYVTWFITKEGIKPHYKRSNNFRPDNLITTGSATPEDYFRSGYDRGHMKPAADAMSDAQVSETFYMSNMCPQLHRFNAGIWLDLEKYTRKLTNDFDTVWVESGTYLNNGLPKINDRVSIPDSFYKIITTKGGKMCFIMTQRSKGDLWNFLVPCDEIKTIKSQ